MCWGVDQQAETMESAKTDADGYVIETVDPDKLVPELQSHPI